MHIAYIYLNNQYKSREMCAYKTLMNVYGSFFFRLLVHSHFFICVSLQLLCIKNLVLYFSETFLLNRWIALVAKTCNRYSRCLDCPAFCCFSIVFSFFLQCILYWFLCCTFFNKFLYCIIYIFRLTKPYSLLSPCKQLQFGTFKKANSKSEKCMYWNNYSLNQNWDMPLIWDIL